MAWNILEMLGLGKKTKQEPKKKKAPIIKKKKSSISSFSSLATIHTTCPYSARNYDIIREIRSNRESNVDIIKISKKDRKCNLDVH